MTEIRGIKLNKVPLAVYNQLYAEKGNLSVKAGHVLTWTEFFILIFRQWQGAHSDLAKPEPGVIPIGYGTKWK